MRSWLRKSTGSMLGLVAMAILALLVVPTFATNFGSGTYGKCTYNGCGITISSSSNLSLNVTPTSSGSCTIQNDSVSVQTVNNTGFTLSLIGSSANSNLINGAKSIAVSSATKSSPAVLTANAWGYRVDNVGGFGAGPTTSQTNIMPSSLKFAGIPNSTQSADTVATTAVAANPAVTTNVWYGVCANTNTASGTYTAQVLYTAVVN